MCKPSPESSRSGSLYNVICDAPLISRITAGAAWY